MNDFNNITNKFIKGNWNFKTINKNTEYHNFYIKSKQDIDNIINYKYITELLNNAEITNTYFEILKSYNYKLIKQSDIHGISHIIRTSLFLLIISILEKINIEDFKILLESILYHDIGRINDIDDEYHGYNATKEIIFLKEKYNDNDYKMICSIITGHCIDDELYENVASYFNIKNTTKYLKLLSIIKDADALDRVREYPYIDIKYLRTNSAKKLVPFAYEFFYNYT